MATSIEIVQGDSYAEDFVDSSIVPEDLGYSDWAGSWAVVDRLSEDNVELAAGTLTKVVDPHLRLTLRIIETTSETIPAGKYKLVVRLVNPTLGFKKEIKQETFKVLPSGL